MSGTAGRAGADRGETSAFAGCSFPFVRENEKLFRGRRYVLKVRLYWAGQSGMTAVMYW